MFDISIYMLAISFVLLGALVGLYFIIIVPSRNTRMSDLLSKAKYSDAIVLLKDVVRREPFNTKAMFDLAELYWIVENYTDANYLYQLLLEKNIPSNMYEVISVRVAQWNIQQRQFASAKTTLENLLVKNPKHVDALSLLGDIYYEHKDYKECVTLYKQALDEDSNNLHCWKRISKSYFNLNMYIDAHKSYAHAINIDPKNPELWYYAAESHFLLGDLDKALRFFTKIEQYPESLFHFKALLRLSDIYHIKLNETSYVQYLEKARTTMQKDDLLYTINQRDILEVHYKLGDVYVNSKHMELALKEWEQILHINPLFRDVSKKYRSYYTEFVEDLFKDMIILRGEPLIEVLTEFLKMLNYEIESIQQFDESAIEVYARELHARLGNQKRERHIIAFWCSDEPVPEDVFASLYSKISKNIVKGMVISPAVILSETREYLNGKFIEIYDQTNTETLIHERKNA